MTDNPIEVIPGLWFGPYDYTYRPECLATMTHIVNCDSEESSTSTAARARLKFLHVPSQDKPSYKILDTHLERVRKFIEDATAAYIHCYMGSNRSAALAVALALERTDESLHAILERVRGQTLRPILDNPGFVEQLREKAFRRRRTSTSQGQVSAMPMHSQDYKY